MPDTYSQSILEGLAKLRPTIVDPAARAGIGTDRLTLVVCGEAEFTDEEIGRLEELADLTGLELALAAIGPDGESLNGVAAAWACVRADEQVARSSHHPSERPAAGVG